MLSCRMEVMKMLASYKIGVHRVSERGGGVDCDFCNTKTTRAIRRPSHDEIK